MSKRETISRYNHIINRIRKSPATFGQIRAYLELQSEIHGYDFCISKRTFKRDQEDILSLYYIDIRYDFSKKVYYINDEEQPEMNNRMLEAFDTFNVLNVANGFARYVHFESRKPQGTEHFYGLLHAIKNSQTVSFTYQKFWDDRISLRKVAPYALKEFKGRWYILAKDEKDSRVKTFGLDRIQNLEITKKRFEYPEDYDVAEQFKNCFGIINPPHQKVEKVILSFDAEQGKYLKSFPLHASQQLLIDSHEELRLSLEVMVTHDFVMEILSYGERVEVLAPPSLKKEVKRQYEQALRYYY